MVERTKIFVSYSSDDRQWKEELETHLKALQMELGVEYFIDDHLQPGERWFATIKDELSKANVFILLLTPAFFSSEFIRKEEIPVALKAAEEEGALLLLLTVRRSRLQALSELGEFQAVNPPSEPLNALPDHQRDVVYAELVERLEQHFTEESKAFNPPKVIEPKIESGPTSSEWVRKEYAEIQTNLRSLKLWVENTFSEWCFQDDEIYQCDVRIKEIDSLIKKVASFRASGRAEIHTIQQLKEEVNDLVGARLLVYKPSTLYSLHAAIMSHSRFIVTKVAVHYKEGARGHILDNIIALSPGIVRMEPNDTGYRGVHYIIAPNPVDSIYRGTYKYGLYEKFELQIRTLIQHAWSELQHQVIYKGSERGNIDTGPQFAMLSGFIGQCDDVLDRLADPSKLVDTQPLREGEGNPELDAIIGGITTRIENFAVSRISSTAKYHEVRQYLEEHGDDVNRIMADGFVGDRLQLGEYLLKGGHYKAAFEHYQQLVECGETNNEGWILLRLAEAADALAYEEEVKSTIKKLYVFLSENESNGERGWKLVAQASVLAWKYRAFDIANSLGTIALDSARGRDSHEDLLKSMSNKIYYSTEIAIESVIASQKKLQAQELLAPLGELIELVEELEFFDEHHTIQSVWDTLAWYYYWLAKGEHELRETDGKALERAEAHVTKAASHMARCLRYGGTLTPAQIQHSTEITVLCHRLEVPVDRVGE